MPNAIAPPELWQFYSAQGLSGSCKFSFYGRMIHIYKAVLVAVVSKTGKDKSAIVMAISEVLKTVHNRAGTGKYCNAHPEEMLKHSVAQQDNERNLVTDFARKKKACRSQYLFSGRTSSKRHQHSSRCDRQTGASCNSSLNAWLTIAFALD